MGSNQVPVIDEKLGLEMLLGDADIRSLYETMSGRLGEVPFYQAALKLLRRKETASLGSGYVNIAAMYSRAVGTAQALLDHERARKPLYSPTDADSIVICNAETGEQHIVVGGGPQDGGYSIAVMPEGENRVIPK
ncbi:MAG TPA: hypothetical protein VI934_02535 [Candidatus Nanoarchaeia archaeon]|nr:hypothetical protein [Candidatus Nanoarchaeia archaeon]